MSNYNQKFKDQVIVTVNNNKNRPFDDTVTNGDFFSAVGKNTSNDLTQLTQIKPSFTLWCVKQDYMLKESTTTVNIHDDDGSLDSFNITSRGMAVTHTKANYVNFNTRDNNITFDDFGGQNGMTESLADITNSNIGNFTAVINIPDDVKCNYSNGSHKFIKGQGVNFLFDGTIKKDDTITIKRTNRPDHTSTVAYDTDLIFSCLGIDAGGTLEIIYTHKSIPVEPTTVEFTSDDPGIQWQNSTMQDSGASFNNTLVVQNGYILNNQLKINYTDTTGKTGVLTFTNDSASTLDGDSDNNKWNIPINTGYASLTVVSNQATLKKYEIIPTLQNAAITTPEPIEDDYGKTRYYLDQKHTTIIIKANEGYTFNDAGSLSYQRTTDQTATTITIPATNTDTVTFSLPTDFDWSNLNTYQTFKLTIGATKAEVVETAGGFTNIYKADYTNLLKFSNEVIVKSTGSGSLQPYDFTQYIHNLVMLPFNIPASNESAIIAGNESFTTTLPTIDNQYLKVDLGKITVSEQYKNAYDYYQVKTRLMLPYTDMIELDPKHVINQTVSIEYNVNVINGDTTINLLNGSDLFYSKQVNLSSEIPFMTNIQKGSQYTVINRLKTAFRNSIKQAYIIIEQPTPILHNDFYPTREISKVTSYQGRLKASLLDGSGIDDSDDFAELQNLLSQGVIYNA